MTKENRKLFLPIALFFILFNSFVIATRNRMLKYGISQDVLIIGNMIIAFTTAAALYFHIKGFLNKNVQVFLRSVYGALMIKMFICAAAVIIYAFAVKKEVNKPAIFICMALYLIYSFIEVRMIFRLLKQVKKQ
jgi:hypothetical protein